LNERAGYFLISGSFVQKEFHKFFATSVILYQELAWRRHPRIEQLSFHPILQDKNPDFLRIYVIGRCSIQQIISLSIRDLQTNIYTNADTAYGTHNLFT
jgi:hypothetical protein